MNAKHRLAALALAVLMTGTALAGETIHATESQLKGVVEGSSYTVRSTEENGREVATQIVQDDS